MSYCLSHYIQDMIFKCLNIPIKLHAGRKLNLLLSLNIWLNLLLSLNSWLKSADNYLDIHALNPTGQGIVRTQMYLKI